MKIVFTTYLPKEGFAGLSVHNMLMPSASQQIFSPEELLPMLRNADILVSTFDYKITMEMLGEASSLKMIANFGSGYNNLPTDYCREHGIMVTNTPEPVIEPTAEHAWALLNALAHRTAELDRRLRMPEYDGIRFGVMQNLGTQLYGKTLGIVGMGNIGQALARRAVAGGMKIIYHNRHRLPDETEHLYNANYASLDELLRTADVVSLNLPYTPQVHHLINKETLAMMRPTALLLNTARGAHVDEAALIEALRTKQIGGAALDVYENEPHISQGLLEMDNVVLSPHIGTGTWEGRISMCRCVSENIQNFINNNIHLLNSVL